MRTFLPLLVLLGLLTACAPARTGTGDGAARAENDLLVEYDPGDGSEPDSWMLVCGDPAGGTHPDPAAACAHLAGLEDPFAPLAGDLACTEQYGGPQTAHVTGLWRGEPIDVELSRTDGCRISQWAGLDPLLPSVAGQPVN